MTTMPKIQSAVHFLTAVTVRPIYQVYRLANFSLIATTVLASLSFAQTPTDIDITAEAGFSGITPDPLTANRENSQSRKSTGTKSPGLLSNARQRQITDDELVGRQISSRPRLDDIAAEADLAMPLPSDPSVVSSRIEQPASDPDESQALGNTSRKSPGSGSPQGEKVAPKSGDDEPIEELSAKALRELIEQANAEEAATQDTQTEDQPSSVSTSDQDNATNNGQISVDSNEVESTQPSENSLAEQDARDSAPAANADENAAEAGLNTANPSQATVVSPALLEEDPVDKNVDVPKASAAEPVVKDQTTATKNKPRDQSNRLTTTKENAGVNQSNTTSTSRAQHEDNSISTPDPVQSNKASSDSSVQPSTVEDKQAKPGAVDIKTIEIDPDKIIAKVGASKTGNPQPEAEKANVAPEHMITVDYVVERGDSFDVLANRYAIDLLTLKSVNPGITEPLKAGQTVQVPIVLSKPAKKVNASDKPQRRAIGTKADNLKSAPTTTGKLLETTRIHKVRVGENLEIIADKYDTTVKKLALGNGLSLDANLKAGTLLVITLPPTETALD